MKKSFFICLVFIGSSCFSQSNFLPGYVVLNSRDTLYGDIDYLNWNINPEKITFRRANVTQEYEVQHLGAFGVTGEDHYLRKTITYQLGAIEISDAQESFDSPSQTKDVWLRVLYRSDYSLLEYNTPKRVYFFVLHRFASHGELVDELVYRIRLYNGQLEKDEQYKNKLQLFADHENKSVAVQKFLATSDYNRKDLLKVFSLLNEGKSSFEDKKAIPVKKDITGGIVFYSFTSSGTPVNDGSGAYFLNTATWESTVGFRLGIGFTFASQRNFGRLQSRLGINLASLKLTGENTNSGNFQKEEYNGEAYILEPNYKLLFSLNPLKNAQFLIGPAIGYSIILKSSMQSRFENPGVVTVKDDFPRVKGGFLSGGLDVALAGSFGRVTLHYIRIFNMIDGGTAIVTGNGFGISYGYIF